MTMSPPTRMKYGRTFHLPFSPGATSDDKMHAEVETLFAGEQIVVTEKMDGESTAVYPDGYCHARSLDSKNHKSRDWVKKLAGRVGREGLPDSLRLYGENLYARHSIAYNALPSYFMVFAIYEADVCLSWDETVEWCQLLELDHVPVLYRGPWDEEKVRACWTGQSVASPGDGQEGYVVRLARRFKVKDMGPSLAKWVRPHHVQTDDHWMHQAIVPNGLRLP